MECIPLRSVSRCRIKLKYGQHHEKCKHNVHIIAILVPYSGMGVPNCQTNQPEHHVSGVVSELYLDQSTDQWNNCDTRGMSVLGFSECIFAIDHGKHRMAFHIHFLY